MLTYQIEPRLNQTDKNGLTTMYIRIIDQREVKRYALDLKLDLKHFDLKNTKAKVSMKNYIYVNSILSKYEKKANKITLDYSLNEKPLSIEVFKNYVLGKEEDMVDKGGDFYAFIKARLLVSNFSFNTQRGYTTFVNLLTEYSPKLTFKDLDYNFIIGFRHFVSVEKKNVENSCNKKMKQLGALINEAIKQDLMTENPVRKIKFKNIKPHRERLELHEVEKLQALYDLATLKVQEQNVLQYFLFCCYTGLRFSDVEQFNTDMILNGTISIVAEKTNEMVTIPLLDEARALLPADSKQFRVISNQKTNAALKRIIEVAEIRKKVSTHTARHSFATIGISSGIPIEVISKILGHTDLKTTMIYAKIMDDVKIEAMKKWGKKKTAS